MAGIEHARARAVAVLRVRGYALGAACLPAAAAAVILAGLATGRFGGGTALTAVAWVVTAVGVLSLLLAAAVGAVLLRARPAESPVVPLAEKDAPDLYRLVRELSSRLDVPAPAGLALTPDCDSWLEERRDAPPDRRDDGSAASRTVLVVGSPFLWWMRVAELRALLAPVVSGTAAAADTDIAGARRFVRGLDAAVAIADRGGRRGSAADAALLAAAADGAAGATSGMDEVVAPPAAAPGPPDLVGLTDHPEGSGGRTVRPRRGPGNPALALLGRIARLLLRACRGQAAEMERAVAAWASEHAQSVDFGLRVAAQQQVGLAYAGWDRLLTRVALPAWRMGRWPSRLNAGVVSALTELSRRDRLAEGFETRLGERPACDLLEQPGAMDAETSLLAARLFHGAPQAAEAADWSPVTWSGYPDEIVGRVWRTRAAELHEVLGRVGAAAPGESDGSTLERMFQVLAAEDGAADRAAGALVAAEARRRADRAADWTAPVVELQPPRTGRELLAEHVTAMVCCAVADTAGGRPGLDWLDGPVLRVRGERRGDLAAPVQQLLDGDGDALRAWLGAQDVRMDKPVGLG